MNYKTIRKIEEIEEYLGDSRLVAFDFETSAKEEYREEEYAALDAHKSEITGLSLSVEKDTAVYIPLRHRGYANADADAVMSYLKCRLFQNSNIVKVAHNLAFEAMFLYALGIVVQEPVYDTIVASQLTLKSDNEFRGLGDSGLKTLVPYLYGIDLPKFEEVVNGKITTDKITGKIDRIDNQIEGGASRSFDELNPDDWDTVRYACADSDYTLQLYDTFNAWFKNNIPQHRYVCEKIESPTAVFTGMMKYNGVGVDTDLMKEKQAEAYERIIKIRGQLGEIIGDVDLGNNAGTQAFKDYLYKTLKLPVMKTTAKYQDAADDEAMQLLSAYCKQSRPELCELFELIQEFRKWAKIKSTYIDGYLEQVNKASGRIHPDLMPMGTDTGRFASRRPNMQNMPRKGGDPIGVRNFIVAAPGKTFVDFDFSQIELRVGAYYCRDEKMIDTYLSGGDIHAQTTAVIFGGTAKEAQDKTNPNFKEHRTIAKNCNFGVFFGLFAKGLQRTLKFKGGVDKSIAECEEIIRNLKMGYPQLTVWQKDVIAKAKADKFSETAFGRRRYLKGINSADWGIKSYNERCALNTPIQGTAADILKLSMCRLIKELLDKPYIKPILQVHDELLFEVDEDKVNEAAEMIKRLMEVRPFEEFDLPIIAEGEIGKCFGKLEEIWQEK